ncbi:hypothetical protein JCM5353_008550, partial [Sporobolomyces roseus]
AEKRAKKKENSKKGRKRAHEMEQKKQRENRENSKPVNASPADPSPIPSGPPFTHTTASTSVPAPQPTIATADSQQDAEMVEPPSSSAISQPRPSVLYFPSSGEYPQGPRKGQSVNGQLSKAFETGLKSTPWIDPHVCTVGEGYSSSVCPDPKCRAR